MYSQVLHDVGKIAYFNSLGYSPHYLTIRSNKASTITLIIDGKEYIMLVDSGSTDSYISSEEYIKKRFILSAPKTGSGLIGTSLDYCYNDRITVKKDKIVSYGFYFRNISSIQRSFITNGISSIDGIIGHDFLASKGAIVDYSIGVIYLPN